MATYTCIPKRMVDALSTEDLFSEAKDLGIDVLKVTEAEFARAVSDKRAERWLKENAEAIESYNAYVEQHGLPLEKYRMF
ncbi:type II toxin-antitoxin system CcdA family antitoxin [Paraburkholderia ferrariae]|jgi:antitoxin CcdA|uniref:type II toxin-antitoxin system CcdA family antitoxin n=1 Tax=Paraburkholderia ferrariae TaxID=386056 RepID=UPI0005A67A3A|nr:type II toxin-antitoxin system CcdA family antitoxin [Paraburkholderia ferrariae]